MKNVISCCLLLLLSSCYEAQEKTTTSSVRTPSEFRWENSPGQLVMVDLPNPYDSDVMDMSAEWNKPFKKNLLSTNYSGNANLKTSFTTIEETRDGNNAIYLVPVVDWPSHATTALGITILLGRTNDDGQYIISEADIIIKDVQAYDARTIIIHELGHFMGLNHSSNPSSVMFGTVKMGENKRVPLSADYKELAQLYNLSYGATPQSKQGVIKKGTGELQRMVFELGADKTCRHLLDGDLIGSHTVDL